MAQVGTISATDYTDFIHRLEQKSVYEIRVNLWLILLEDMAIRTGGRAITGGGVTFIRAQEPLCSAECDLKRQPAADNRGCDYRSAGR